MSKNELARQLSNILAPASDPAERERIYKHHCKRSVSQVRESLARWKSINAVTPAELTRHCQFDGLPLMGK